MPTCERIVFDPSEEIEGRTEIDVTPWIGQEGIDWGDAGIAASMAETTRGEYPIDYRVPNRQVTGPLRFTENRGGTTANQARYLIQQKIALFQREGGMIKRVTLSGGTVYGDVVDASLRVTSASGVMARQGYDIDASFTLSLIPDFFGPEAGLGDQVNTANSELIWTETGIEGDYPARMRMVIDNDEAAVAQRTLLWGFRASNYNPAYPLTLQEGDFTGYYGTAVALAGAIGGTAIRMSCTQSYRTLGYSNQSIYGNYRVIGRMYSSSAGTVYAVLEWDADGLNSIQNEYITVLGGGQFSYHDFGVISLPRPVVGNRHSVFYIRAGGVAGGEDVAFDKLWLQPLDDYSGRMEEDTDSLGVLAAAKSAELRTEGYYMERTAGDYYEMPIYGDLPRLPVPAMGTAGTIQVFLKPIRGALGGPGSGGNPATGASGVSDDISAQIYMRPSWLFVDDT